MRWMGIFLLLLPLQAEFTALLLKIEHNNLFHFSYHDCAFSCEPAALVTLTRLYNSKRLIPSCKEKINSFVKAYPFIPYQAEWVLHEDQKYMIKPLDKKCFIMLDAGTTFTEYMIERGYGMLPKVIDPKLANTVLLEKLILAQKRAQYHKKGIWTDPVLLNCFAQD